MTTETEYQKRIARYKRRDLLKLWNAIEANRTPEWDAGKAFEYLILRAFQLEGAEVRWPYTVQLSGEPVEQIDGAVYTDGLAGLLECKDQANSINVEPIAKLRNQLLRRPAPTLGLVFSRQGFTDAAATLARFMAPQTILLWSGAEIKHALQAQVMRLGLVIKYRRCIEEGIPDYNLSVEGVL